MDWMVSHSRLRGGATYGVNNYSCCNSYNNIKQFNDIWLSPKESKKL